MPNQHPFLVLLLDTSVDRNRQPEKKTLAWPYRLKKKDDSESLLCADMFPAIDSIYAYSIQHTAQGCELLCSRAESTLHPSATFALEYKTKRKFVFIHRTQPWYQKKQ